MSLGAIFSVWRNSVIHLCFICTLMSDITLSDCPSAAICYMAKIVVVYWWEGSTSTATSPTSVTDVAGQQNKTGGITFGVALIFSGLVFYRCKWKREAEETDMIKKGCRKEQTTSSLSALCCAQEAAAVGNPSAQALLHAGIGSPEIFLSVYFFFFFP